MMAPTQSIISFNYLSIIDRQFRDVTQRGRAEPASVCHCVCVGVWRCVAVCGGSSISARFSTRFILSNSQWVEADCHHY